jgi:hypothetical protein
VRTIFDLARITVNGAGRSGEIALRKEVHVHVHTFFDVQLKGAPANLLDDARQARPVVQAVPR